MITYGQSVHSGLSVYAIIGPGCHLQPCCTYLCKKNATVERNNLFRKDVCLFAEDELCDISLPIVYLGL